MLILVNTVGTDKFCMSRLMRGLETMEMETLDNRKWSQKNIQR